MSEKSRDELIAGRARRDSEGPESCKPVMVIDRERIPHGFVVGKRIRSISGDRSADSGIGHSERIAEKAKTMINDLRRLNRIKSTEKGDY